MQPANLLHIATLDENWADKDQVMLHACFQLLVDCVEKEQLLDGHVSWDDQPAISAELMELYLWWQQRVVRDRAEAIDGIWASGQHEEDTTMLIRLVKLRGYLWT